MTTKKNPFPNKPKKPEKAKKVAIQKQEIPQRVKRLKEPPLPKIRYEHYLFSLDLDDKVIELEVKAPTLEKYNNFIHSNNAEQFMFDCVIKPSKDELKQLLEQYPGLIDFFGQNILSTFKSHFFNLGKTTEKKWKHFETHYYEGALTILDIINKPKNEENTALCLLFLDGLACLRHLRLVYSAKR